eukprot:GEMP01028706.1.p1 GENE.GEMP01028706.1~~GEMP01028706.1.p1  ORF type:complete len:643 (+),score=157.04 GEMP01028706.1:34-1929(+)
MGRSRERSRSQRRRSRSRNERRRRSKWDDGDDAAAAPGAAQAPAPQNAPEWVKEMFQPSSVPQAQDPLQNPMLQQALASMQARVVVQKQVVQTSEKPVYVEDSLVGKLIGKGGANIDRLRRESGADIQFDKEPIAGGVRRVVLSGTAEQLQIGELVIQLAVQDILSGRKIGSTVPGQPPPDPVMQEPMIIKEMKLQPLLVGAFIGPKGAHVSALRDQVGVKLEVRNDHQTTPGADAAILIGPGIEMVVDRAIQMVEVRLEEIRADKAASQPMNDSGKGKGKRGNDGPSRFGTKGAQFDDFGGQQDKGGKKGNYGTPDRDGGRFGNNDFNSKGSSKGSRFGTDNFSNRGNDGGFGGGARFGNDNFDSNRGPGGGGQYGDNRGGGDFGNNPGGSDHGRFDDNNKGGGGARFGGNDFDNNKGGGARFGGSDFGNKGGGGGRDFDNNRGGGGGGRFGGNDPDNNRGDGGGSRFGGNDFDNNRGGGGGGRFGGNDLDNNRGGGGGGRFGGSDFDNNPSAGGRRFGGNDFDTNQGGGGRFGADNRDDRSRFDNRDFDRDQGGGGRPAGGSFDNNRSAGGRFGGNDFDRNRGGCGSDNFGGSNYRQESPPMGGGNYGKIDFPYDPMARHYSGNVPHTP